VKAYKNNTRKAADTCPNWYTSLNPKWIYIDGTASGLGNAEIGFWGANSLGCSSVKGSIHA
jgi:hypothetical protein